ncbi:DUF4383 domain-containing protein [Arthrobacter silvisoli]|uniref:DUF4383 domain-containing protein n=1 Tax=Arthrobacter silvisoli TaxID=2291022 RepID=UPI000E219374|nr:DUF4383 domain-containing protein [Arthrobacter silvisoli]
MSSAASHAQGVHFGRQDIQVAGIGVALLVALVGVLGFVPGITTQYSEMRFFGPDSQAMLLGLFQVSVLLNLVQLAVGVSGWFMSRTVSGARAFLYGFGALYVVLSAYGLGVGTDSAANFLSVNILDNWTHLVLGILMMTAGWMFWPNQSGGRK